MFSYFCAISPNQLTDIKSILLASLTTFSFSFLSAVNSFTPSHSHISSPLCSNIPYSLSFFNSVPILSFAIILFLTIVAVIKISTRTAGPLRPFVSEHSLIKHQFWGLEFGLPCPEPDDTACSSSLDPPILGSSSKTLY